MISIEDVIEERKIIRKKRRMMLDDDGHAISYYNTEYGWPITENSFLGFLFGPHRGIGNHIVPDPTPSDITSIVFCTDGPGWALRKSTIPNMFIGTPYGANPPQYVDATVDIINNTGKDALQITSEFCDQNDMELFYSIRISDRHDSTATDPNDLVPIKRDFYHEGKLIPGNYGLDFEFEECRNLMFDMISEVVNNDDYSLTGVSINFNRHLGLFRNTAAMSLGERIPTTQAQMDLITSWLADVRNMMDVRSTELMGDGKDPLLLHVYIPDDEDYAKGCALDIVRWMDDGLVDMISCMGYHQFNSLRHQVLMGHSRKIPVYVTVQDSRLSNLRNRGAEKGQNGRVIQAMGCGSDGIYFFNRDWSEDPHHMGPSGRFWRRLGSVGAVVESGECAFYPTYLYTNSQELGGSGAAEYPLVSNSFRISLISSDTPFGGNELTATVPVYGMTEKTADLNIFGRFGSAPVVMLNDSILSVASEEESVVSYEIPSGYLVDGDNIIVIQSGAGFLLDDIEVSG